MPTGGPDRDAVATAVWDVLIAESRLSLWPDQLSGAEPLNGHLLRISSFSLLAALLKLEDALDVVLPDDLFTGRTFQVVDDVIDVVFRGVQ